MFAGVLNDLEWHDGKIESLTIYPDSQIELRFAHVSAYYALPSGQIEVWSVKIALQFLEISGLFLNGQLLKDDYIGDGALLDGEGREVNLLVVGSEQKMNVFDLYLAGSGNRLKILAKSVRIISLEPLEKLEDLDG